jgi:amidohydrolase
MSTVTEVLAGYDGLETGQEAFYKDLHEHPELSHREHRTARQVAGKLHEYGFAVEEGIGGTGVVGSLANGRGPAVLLRCELDALPVREDTGAPYASTVTTQDADGHQVPVAHACGHDLHMSCMLGMAKLMADHRGQWGGTLLTLFQPGEETGDGAQGMVDDGLLKRIPVVPDVALAQHLLPGIAGTVATCPGPFMTAEDGIRVTVYGRGGHGAMPQHTVDPVVLAAMIIVRLQTVVSREVAPADTAVLSVGSVQAGTVSNLIPDHATLQLNLRSYTEPVRQRMLDAVRRIVRAECEASGSPRDPDFATLVSFPVMDNDPATTDRVATAFAAQFGDNALHIEPQTVSEDFGNIPKAMGIPYTYWAIGFTDRQTYLAAEKAGRLEDLPTNHSPKFLPPMQPCLRTGTAALVTAALAWLAQH